MKKYFVMALVALATMTFVSCEKKNQEVKDGKVVLEQKKLSISVGEEAKLRASLDPAKDGLAITFASEDAKIATVKNTGIVTGVAAGEVKIIATAEGYKADTCVVTVTDPLDAFAWGSMGLFKVDNTKPIGQPYTYEGEKIQNYEGTWYIWDQDIIYTDGVGFSGAGYIAQVKCPTAIIAEGQYKGYYATWELNFDNTMPADSSGVTAEGSLTNAQEWGTYLMDSTYTGDGSFKGTPIHFYDWDDETGENDVPFVGFIKNGWIGDYSNGFFYQMNITWFDLGEGLYGLKMEQDAEGKWGFVKPYEFTTRYEKFYEVMPAKSPARKMRVFDLRNDKKIEQRLNKAISTNKARVQ